MLLLSMLCAWWSYALINRLLLGWSVEISGDVLTIPALLRWRWIPVADVRSAGRETKLFGELSYIRVKLRDGTKLRIGPVNGEDAQEFVRLFETNRSASPASPPAT